MKPIVVINFKTYMQEDKLLKLAKTIEKIDPKIIVGAPASEVSDLSSKTKLRVYVQHVDPHEPGRNTGYILPEAVKKQGAKGVFLNHSEHRLDFKTIKKTVERCKNLKLKVLLFAASLKEAKKLKKLDPDYLVIEPPELVAGKTSVSKEKPELIEKIAKNLNYPFLVGAGIKDNDDLKIAMKLGANGIALASAITKSKDPKKKLKELLGK